jgi:hypothetical protein
VLLPGYHTFWKNKRSSTLKSGYQTLVQKYPEAAAQLKQLLKVMGDIEDVAGHTPTSVGKSEEWAVIENRGGRKRSELLQRYPWKPTFSALYGAYTVTLQELKAVLKVSTLADQTHSPKATGQHTTQEDGF